MGRSGRRAAVRTHRGALLTVLALTGAACEARTYAGALIRDGYGGAPMFPEVPSDQPFTIPDGLMGTWTGYFEGYTLRSGTDAVTLTLEHRADGGDQIRVVFGTEPPPPPASLAIEPWLPGNPDSGPFDGFVYLAHEVRWRARWLTFTIATWDPWQGWCELQTSYPSPAGARNRCVPVDADCSVCAGSPPPAPTTPCRPSMSSGAIVVCAQLERCQGTDVPCLCDATRCESDPTRNRGFDLTFDSDVAATGSMSPQAVPLRLMR